MFDGTLGKHTGSDYTIELKEDAKSIMPSLFLFQSFTNQLLKKKLID